MTRAGRKAKPVATRKVKTIRTPAKRQAFLEALALCGNVTEACRRARVARNAMYEWRAEDGEFARAWELANERGTDALEDEATRRGHLGTLRPVFQGGKRVGLVRDYSDTLLIFMLKARRPERFKDRVATELTGKDGGPVQMENVRERIASRLARITGTGPA